MIFWDFWIAAQQWDEIENIGCRLNRHLTSEGVNLDKTTKMRNGFAIAALNSEMLELMKVSCLLLFFGVTSMSWLMSYYLKF